MVSIVLTSACLTSLKVLDDTYQPHQRYDDCRQAEQKREHTRPPMLIARANQLRHRAPQAIWWPGQS